MSDGRQNEKPIKNSLLSGASGNYLFDDFNSATLLPLVEPIITDTTDQASEELASSAAITEIDLNSDDHGSIPLFSHFIPQDMPHASSSVFQSPPTPSSVQLFTQDPGQYTTPTQAISSPVISSDSYSSMSNLLIREPSLLAESTVQVEENASASSGNDNESMGAFATIKTTLASLVHTLTGYSSSHEGENNPMHLQRTNTSTTAGTGNTEITNVVPSSYVSDVYRRVPEPFGALQTPPLSTPSTSGTNNFRKTSQKPVYAQYPGLINSPAPSSTSVPPAPTEPMSTPPGSPINPAYATAYTTANELGGSGYNFGLPTPSSVYGADNRIMYQPVPHHWFYRKEVDGRLTWKPFSMTDSVALEESYTNQWDSPVATDGGRYDVFISERLRKAVYWDEDPSDVRRCSWFYKGPMDSRFIPYDEEFSAKLEEEYYNVMQSGVWHKRLEFMDGEAIVFHSAGVIVHFCQAAAPDEWGSVPESQIRPRVVRRGVAEEFEIHDGECSQIDHLVFLVHGIGAICDFKFRCIDEAVDGFRNLSTTLMRDHFKSSMDSGKAGRIEFLPVSWHKELHGDRGVDKQLEKLTLPSIPKLRHFTNDTLLDILFYTSPIYCQTIIKAVGTEMNRIYNLFVSRTKNFKGDVAVGGHSLGSLILFDLLSHQPGLGTKNTIVNHVPSTESVSSPPMSQSQINIIRENSSSEELPPTTSSEIIFPQPGSSPKKDSYSLGSASTGQPFIVYPVLDFHPTAFFAMGSPTAMFVTVRGVEKLEAEFHLPTCPAFFNIFHPYDPVAYRMEPLIGDDYDPEPVLINHHKGRKRLHLELKETVMRVSRDLTTKLVDGVMYTINTLTTPFAKKTEAPTVEPEKLPEPKPEVVTKQIDRESCPSRLNKGRRIDYVLQEAPVESINEYLFALSSHVCYWESEDTLLMILKEIYSGLGIEEDQPRNNPSQTQIQDPDPTDIGPAAKVMMKNNEPCCSKTLDSQKPQTSGSLRTSVAGTAPPMENPLSMFTDIGPTNHIRSTLPPIPMLNPQYAPNAYHTSTQQYDPVPLSATASAPSLLQTSPPRSASNANTGVYNMGMDPTAPPSNSSNIGPPPLAGFQRRGYL